MNKTINAFRVIYEYWIDDDKFLQVMDLLEKHRGISREIAFLTASTHAPLPIDELTRRTDVIKERMRAARALGYSCGINLLATIGHHPEDLKNSFTGDYTRMTNSRKECCAGSFCWNDERYIADYVEPVYRILARAKPDFIWIDDDVRAGHVPIGAGCFCDRCVKKFLAGNQLSMTREELLLRLDEGDLELRRKWLRFESESIASLFEKISLAVHEVSDDIILGFMTGERYFEGYDFGLWAQALSRGGKYPVMWRPGGGAWQDDYLIDVIQKSAEIGRQVACLPACATAVQAEIEAFPYQIVRKSPRTVAMEAALYLSKGCNAVVYNLFPSETGEPAEHLEAHFSEIEKHTGFFEKIVSAYGGGAACGVHSGWHPHNQALTVSQTWMQAYGGDLSKYCAEFFTLGLPEAYHPAHASVFCIFGKTPYLLSREEILGALAEGVYMDAAAAKALQDLGYGDLIGFDIGEEIPVDAREEYVRHSLNCGFEGERRNGRQAFTPGDSVALIPRRGAETLTRLIDYHGRELAACAMGVYVNRLGGRVCVAGYYPNYLVSFTSKALQMYRVFRFLSKDRLEIFPARAVRMIVSAFRAKDGTLSATLFNNNIHALVDTELYVNTKSERLLLIDPSGKESVLPQTGRDGGYGIFRIPEIGPWDMALITEKTEKKG